MEQIYVHFWVSFFGLFCIGISAVVFIGGWVASKRNKRKWKERCEQVRQEMVEREKREKNNIY